MDDFVHADIITYLKIIFWPNLGVGSAFQVLDILEYAPRGHFLRAPAG